MGTTLLNPGVCWSAPLLPPHAGTAYCVIHWLCQPVSSCCSVPPSCSPSGSPVEAHCPGDETKHGGGPSASESPENSEGGTNSHSSTFTPYHTHSVSISTQEWPFIKPSDNFSVTGKAIVSHQKTIICPSGPFVLSF